MPFSRKHVQDLQQGVIYVTSQESDENRREQQNSSRVLRRREPIKARYGI